MCAALAEADHETTEEAELLPPYCCAILLDGPSVAMDAAEVERGGESSGGGRHQRERRRLFLEQRGRCAGVS
jgi:hypothetical protein